jgi:phosphoserine phosphatase RsbU/P
MTERLSESENQVIVDLRAKNLQLSRAYQDLKEAQAQLIVQERLQKELELARAIQANLLPTEAPGLPGFQFAAQMTPASAVGGDFYDYILTPEHRLGIGIGDVSDHGVPSALMMAQSMTLLRVEARSGASPETALQAINREFVSRDQMGMFLTALYGELDPESGCFAYARAGHNPPLLLDPKGRVEEAPHGPGQPLGLLDDPAIDLEELTLEPGSLMLLYTDGVTEASNESGELYGLDRTQAVLGRLGPAASPDDICQALHADLRSFRGRAEQGDDVTSVAIRAIRTP